MTLIKKDRKNLLVVFGLVLIIIFVISYLIAFKRNKSPEFIIQHQWKYGSGHYIGDWLTFKPTNRYEIKNDTLFKENKAVAVIAEVQKRVFGDNILELKAINSGRTGKYYEKGKVD